MTAQRYRVRHPIEAWQLTADNITQVAEWCHGFDVADLTWDYDIGAYWRPDRGRAYFVPPREPGIVFQSPKGDAFVPLGDYVIRGYQGVFFPCLAVDFGETYEPAPAAGGIEPQPVLAFGELKSLTLRPGDALVALLKVPVTDEHAQMLTRYLGRRFPGHEVAVLDQGADLAVIRREQLDAEET